MYAFDAMFGDALDQQRLGWGMVLISKKGPSYDVDSVYEMERLWYSDNNRFELAHNRAIHHAEITECSVWTVNDDGSLNDKLATFFKPLKE